MATTRGRPGFEASQATRERIVESWGVESVPRRFAAHLRLGLLAEALELRHGATRRKNARENRCEPALPTFLVSARKKNPHTRETYELTFSRSFKQVVRTGRPPTLAHARPNATEAQQQRASPGVEPSRALVKAPTRPVRSGTRAQI